MKKNLLLLDVETAPLPDEELLAIIPPFDEAEVKVGNMVDPKKIEAKIEERRASHFADYKEGAALNAMTAKIVAIGLKATYHPSVSSVIETGDENGILIRTWEAIERFCVHECHSLVGWNVTGFDLIMLCKRSYKHRIKPPEWLRDGRYWSRSIIDLLDVWRLGEFRKEEGKTVGNSLDNVAKFLGLPPKLGDGKDFAELLKRDPKAASAYLIRDLEIVEGIAGIIL